MYSRLALFIAIIPFNFLLAEEKPNVLTQQQIQDGTIMLFDGSTAFGWQIEGTSSAKAGVLVLGGSSQTSISQLIAFPACELFFEYSHDGKKWKEELIKKPFATPSSTRKDDLTVAITKEGLISFKVDAKKEVWLRSIFLKVTSTKELFNGKDLTGWKVFKGDKYKSKFSVTSQGWLNVKDGPGDLQTQGKWANFVAQLECISNGKHLNSGLFFRCLPDQYQQGYEAQIRNQWEGDNREKPVDFGTGAIYRRQPARKVVSTDGEWFTLTVAATGKTLATWVNGYPVANWTDDRKESENARQGAKTNAGALSIQGHDPTTDLSFRKIRILSAD